VAEAHEMRLARGHRGHPPLELFSFEYMSYTAKIAAALSRHFDLQYKVIPRLDVSADRIFTGMRCSFHGLVPEREILVR
jgi:hypothetical protein